MPPKWYDRKEVEDPEIGPGLTRSYRRDVLATFSPAWFTVCMGTGAMQQVLVNFPYPEAGAPQWMRNLGYCFWILDIVLFGVFALIISYQWTTQTGSLRRTILDFPSSSYLGAIPIVSSALQAKSFGSHS